MCISILIVEDIEDGLLREYCGDVSLCDKEGLPEPEVGNDGRVH